MKIELRTSKPLMGVRFPPGANLDKLNYWFDFYPIPTRNFGAGSTEGIWWLWCSGSTGACEALSMGSTPISHPRGDLNFEVFYLMKKTKIVATIGPASESESMLIKLMKAGMNACRLNFSHVNHAEHLARLKNIRTAAEKLNLPIAVLQDLSGPKIRIGDFYKQSIVLKKGGIFSLTVKKCVGDETRAFVNYKTLPKEIKKGDTILLDDGKIRLQAIDAKNGEIKCRVIASGEIKGRRGVNLPGVPLRINSLTPKDKEDLQFGILNKVDYIALSFVRRSSDVGGLKKILNKAKSSARVIAKIETKEAIENIDAIIKEADGIMVARGDLAVEMPADQVPILQKMIIKKCKAGGKPVIVATQMMESMIKSPVPTRAEVSDAANSVLDGADAIMLSEESALGQYPAETVAIMSKVAESAETAYPHRKALYGDIFSAPQQNGAPGRDLVDSVTFAAVSAADAVGAKAIVALTESGFTARMIARYRPAQPLIVMSPKDRTVRQINLSFGCQPVKIKPFMAVTPMIKKVRAILLKHKIVKKGDKIVIAAGVPFGNIGGTNMLLIEAV